MQDHLLTGLDLDAGAVLEIPSVITDAHAKWMYMEAVRHTVGEMQKWNEEQEKLKERRTKLWKPHHAKIQRDSFMMQSRGSLI